VSLPLAFSRKIHSHRSARSAAIWRSKSWWLAETRAYPINIHGLLSELNPVQKYGPRKPLIAQAASKLTGYQDIRYVVFPSPITPRNLKLIVSRDGTQPC